VIESIVEKLDYQKSECDLTNDIFDFFKDYINSLDLEGGLDLKINEYTKSLETAFQMNQNVIDLINFEPCDPNTLEYHVFHSIYSLIEDMSYQKKDSSISDISEEINQVIQTVTDTPEQTAEDSLLSCEQAKQILLTKVYKTDKGSISDISLLESKITFVQFHFADEADKIKILQSFTTAKQLEDFIIAAYEVMKKFLKFNVSISKSDSKKMITAMGLTKFRKKGSHTIYGIELYDSNSVNNFREFSCMVESDCSIKKNRVWLADKFSEMATSFNSLFNLCHVLIEECTNKELINEANDNFNQMYELIIAFIGFTCDKYKFTKKFKF
jgi:Mn-dependent DtxR family transcriptional regulator